MDDSLPAALGFLAAFQLVAIAMMFIIQLTHGVKIFEVTD